MSRIVAADYRSRYADNLGKELPRIPAVKTFADFRAFSQAGWDLAHWHLVYETVDCHPGVVVVCSKEEGAASRVWRSGCRAKRHSLILSGGHI